MRIPHVGGINPTFGQRGPDRVQPLNLDTRFVDQGQEAVGRLARTVGGIAQDMMQERAQEADALARAKAANAVLEDEVEVGAVLEDIDRQHAEGNLGWADIEPELTRRLREREPRKVEGLDPASIEAFNGRLRANQLQALAKGRTIADSGRRMEFRTQFDSSLDALGKLAGDPNADIDKINAQAEAFTPLARLAGVDAATIGRTVQAFKDRNWTNHATRRLMTGRDNPEALAQLEAELSAEDGFYAERLDTEKRNALLSQVLNARARFDAAAQVDAARAEATAERALGQFERSTTLEFGLPDAQVAELAATVSRGTPEQIERFNNVLQVEAEFRQVRFAPPETQKAYLAQKRAEFATTGATPLQQQNLERMTKAADASAKLLTDAPLEHYAKATGRPIEPLDFSGLMSGDPGALAFQIGERAALLEAYRERMGPTTGRALLLPQEADQLSAALGQMTPAQQVRLLGGLNGTVQSREDYTAVMAQIAPTSPVLAAAGALMPGFDAPNDNTTKAQVQFVETMLAGHRALNPPEGQPKFKMPPAADLAAISTTLGPAFVGRNEALQQARAAVEAAYAGLSIEAGDYSGEIDTTRLADAVKRVVGTPVDVGNSSAIPPRGMDEGDFIDAVEASWREASTRLQAGAPTDFDDYVLRQQGANQYALIASDGTYLFDNTGKPLVLTVDPGYKAAPMPSASQATADPFGMSRLLEPRQ